MDACLPVIKNEANHSDICDNHYNHLSQSTTSRSLLPLPRVPLHFPSQLFRKGNLTAFTQIVQAIRTYLVQHPWYDVTSLPYPPHRRCPKCLELYDGFGTIGLHIVDLCFENPYNVPCFRAIGIAILTSATKITTAATIYESSP
jgi:hypothetical protein